MNDTRLDTGSGLLGRVLGADTPVRADGQRESNLVEPWLSAQGVESLAATALRSRDSIPVGVVVVARRDGRPFGRSELEALQKLSDDVTLGLAGNDLARRAQVLSAVEQRLALARDIHDRLAGDLSTASALLKFYEQERTESPNESHRTLLHIRGLVEGALGDARDILSTLRPPTLKAGLRDALEAAARDLKEGFAVDVRVEITGDESILRPEEREAIVRVTVEALANVRKHAGASRASVQLIITESHFELTVEDDGGGISPDSAPPLLGSFGIAGMGERAAMIGATLDVERLLSGGTRVALVKSVNVLGAP